MKLSASYSKVNEGTDYLEVLGFTGNDQKYGEGGVKYNSVQEIFRVTRGVSTLKQLEELDKLTTDSLLEERYQRLLSYGEFNS